MEDYQAWFFYKQLLQCRTALIATRVDQQTPPQVLLGGVALPPSLLSSLARVRRRFMHFPCQEKAWHLRLISGGHAKKARLLALSSSMPEMILSAFGRDLALQTLGQGVWVLDLQGWGAFNSGAQLTAGVCFLDASPQDKQLDPVLAAPLAMRCGA